VCYILDATLRGDLVNQSLSIKMGHYCFIEDNCVISPPQKVIKGVPTHIPVRMNDYVYIGSNSIVEAASIGSHVYIGKNVTIGPCTIIKDMCIIQDNTVIPAGQVVPPLSVVSGDPGIIAQI